MNFDEVSWNNGLGLSDLSLWLVTPCKGMVEEVADYISDQPLPIENRDEEMERSAIIIGKLNIVVNLLDFLGEKLEDLRVEYAKEWRELLQIPEP